MILTVTPNPALDLTYTVGALVPHATHRVSTVREEPGGKGLNVARVLHELGEPVLATGLLGGAAGARVTALLAGAGLPAAFLPIAGETRRTISVVDGADATGFWEPGPQITAREWAAFVAHVSDLLGDAHVVALCGSLPPGAPPDGYATLIRAASARGVPTVLDTSGDPLRHGLAAGPDLAKPNATELTALSSSRAAVPSPGTAFPSPGTAFPSPGTAFPSPGTAFPSSGTGFSAQGSGDELADAGLVLGFGAKAVVVSRGAEGMLALSADGAWRGVPPERLSGNPTGAGDACVAALCRGLRDRTGWPDLLADAVALSAAAVAAPTAGAVDLPTYRRLRPAVRVSAARKESSC